MASRNSGESADEGTLPAREQSQRDFRALVRMLLYCAAEADALGYPQGRSQIEAAIETLQAAEPEAMQDVMKRF